LDQLAGPRPIGLGESGRVVSVGDVHSCAGLGEQRGPLEGALAAADDKASMARQSVEIDGGAGVVEALCGLSIRHLWRNVGEIREAHGHHNVARGDRVTTS
jgi:hypothetical protein